MTTPTSDDVTVTRPPDAFAFGENWQRYIKGYLDSARAEIAKQSLVDFIGESIAEKSFLDIGSGSGLFSLGAYELGARPVVSIDVDPDSVAATNELRKRVANPDEWQVIEASILDSTLVEGLAPADIVYSWGVLHHTGDMHTAIRNAAALVKPQGLFAIAIYNRVTGRFLDSERWWRIKRRYNHSPRAVQRLMQAGMIGYWLAHTLKARRSPWRAAREYTERGMAVIPDLFDWVGGYPFEYAAIDEVVDFCRTNCGMEVLKTVAVAPRDHGLNQFLFRRGT
jgi:2-polyprenyl-6-hydroxyphenyl methylase/3-demethylubiquinone-9 3-methyltransferase